MSYQIIKGINQMEVDGKVIEDKIYLPLEAFWDDYTILKEQKVIFLDSPIAGIEVGLMCTDPKKSVSLSFIKLLLNGAGCKVTEISDKEDIPKSVNLVLELSTFEGIYQTSYGGYIFNGSKRLAMDIGWAISKVFELDYILPPSKKKNFLSKSGFWKKLTIPLICVKWRNSRESDTLIAISILMGLFRFASTKIPLIDENVFLRKIAEQEEIMNDETINLNLNEKEISSVSDPKQELIKELKSTHRNLERTPVITESHFTDNSHESLTSHNPASSPIDASNPEHTNREEIPKYSTLEVDDMRKENSNKSKSRNGKMVTNPSPKLQAYMKKIIAEQNAKAKKEQDKPDKFASEDIYKKAGLGKG